MPATIVLPRFLEIGAGALSRIAPLLQQLCCSRPCIITDPVMQELGYADRLQTLLKDAGLQAGCFHNVIPEPTEASILDAVMMVRESGYDCLLALGGGSAIDSAKAIALLASHGGRMSDYKVPHIVSEQSHPVIAIPTTAGTGSEATRATVITDADSDEKMLCMGPGLIPAAAIVDYELSLSCPPRVTADTGLDALTHAIEAYVSRKANPYSDSQALTAMALIGPNLRTVYREPDNRTAREAMMLGATLAGIAFSNASVCLVHGMSRPIGAHFHVPHGLSNAMLLPSITRYSLAGAPQRYAHCAQQMQLVDAQCPDTDAGHALIEELEALNRDLAVPSLADFGANHDRFHSLLVTMAEQALDSGSPANNPRVPDIDTMVGLYRELWQD